MRKIVINNKKTKELGDLFGIFFEDINHAADGGLYAEMLQNGSFEFCSVDRAEYTPLTAWKISNGTKSEIREFDGPLNSRKHFLHLDCREGDFIINEGYAGGLYLEEGATYVLSLNVRGEAGAIRIGLCTDQNVICEASIKTRKTESFEKYTANLTASTETDGAFLKIVFEQGSLDVDEVSLFPEKTYKNRSNGTRADLSETLAELGPKFMRFPGGCLIHNGNLDIDARNSMYRWEKTIGPVCERPVWKNIWGYNQSLGLGFYEYFRFCEDIGAKPLPVLPAGFNPHNGQGVPEDELEPWILEALHLIEFANGDVNTEWGKKRAEMGHPAPFNLEYIGIGNEEIGDGFFERYPYFHKAIREKYPEIKICNTAGPFAVGEGYEAGWNSAKKHGSDLVDEHYYSSPEWFLGNMHHYDDFDPNGPKVFLGEYASWGNTYYNALVEAAYMTGLEKAPAVALACYAPLLCHKDYRNWSPDLIYFDNHRVVKTANYHVQRLFMNYQGDSELMCFAEGLEAPIRLFDSDRLEGDIAIKDCDVSGKITNLKLTNCDTGEVITVPELAISKQTPETVIGHMTADCFTLEFDFKRSEGRKGLDIIFGRKDNTFVRWEFGGWDNWDCNISSHVNGRGSTISHRIYHVTDETTNLRLEVRGREIKTFLNGELYNDTVDRRPEIEDLYYASSLDEKNGLTYVKIVNLTGEAKETEFEFNNLKQEAHSAEITELNGFALTDENTFEEPEKIVPVSNEVSFEGRTLKYEIAPFSVTVIAVR